MAFMFLLYARKTTTHIISYHVTAEKWLLPQDDTRQYQREYLRWILKKHTLVLPITMAAAFTPRYLILTENITEKTFQSTFQIASRQFKTKPTKHEWND
jgi:hypothetical protein